MTVMIHEIRRGCKAMLIWSASVGGMILLCLMMFPEMKKELGSLMNLFSAMGGFAAAFGMDKLNLGNVMGFYGIYAGAMLGIGSIFYGASLGIGMLSKEEKDHTAEFLLSHPISRNRVFLEKFLAAVLLLLMMNLIILAFALVSFFVIGETPDWKRFWLFHGAQGMMQLEVLALCFGISAFLRRGSLSIGIGIASLLYFLGLVGNITEKAEAVKYITPYTYADASRIISEGQVDLKLAGLGLLYGTALLIAGYLYYQKKDIY